MNLRFLTILVAALAGVTLALLLFRDRGANNDNLDGGAAVFFELKQARDIGEIEIQGDSEDPILLRRNEAGTWVLPEQYGLPVDFPKLNRLVDNLVDAEVARRVTGNPERIERLGLDALRLVLRNPADETLLDVRLGDTADSGGRYFQHADDPAAYVLQGSLFIDDQPNGWYDKTPFDFSAEDIARVQIEWRDGAGLVAVRADPESDFEAEGLDAGSELNSVELAEYIGNLAGIRISNTQPRDSEEAAEARSFGTRVVLNPFEGEAVTLVYGRRPERTVETPADATAGADGAAGEEGEEAADGEEGEEAPEPETIPAGTPMVFMEFEDGADSAWADPAEQLAFEISSFTYDRFALERDAFLLAAEAETAAKTETEAEAEPEPTP